jgi:hypothetical protein
MGCFGFRLTPQQVLGYTSAVLCTAHPCAEPFGQALLSGSATFACRRLPLNGTVPRTVPASFLSNKDPEGG